MIEAKEGFPQQADSHLIQALQGNLGLWEQPLDLLLRILLNGRDTLVFGDLIPYGKINCQANQQPMLLRQLVDLGAPACPQIGARSSWRQVTWEEQALSIDDKRRS